MKTRSLSSKRLSSKKILGKLDKSQNFQFMSTHCFLQYTLIPFERSLFTNLFLLCCSLFEPCMGSTNKITRFCLQGCVADLISYTILNLFSSEVYILRS